MPAERVAMRRVREILRHRFEEGLGHKSIAVRVGAAPSTVRETLRRLERAGLSWPLGEDVVDAVLEAALHKAAGTKTGHRRSVEPDWAHVHRELRRKHVTLQILWDEYIGCCHAKSLCLRRPQGFWGFRRRRPQFSKHREPRADGGELFVRFGGRRELKSSCGWLSAWRRTVARPKRKQPYAS
jgi:hypothetical protein